MANEENLNPFKPGQSGNPKGKPKGKNVKTQILEAMAVVLDLHDPLTGMRTTKKAGEFMYAQMVAKAVKEGDLGAMKEILDRIEGKAIARQENKDVKDWKEDFMDVDED